MPCKPIRLRKLLYYLILVVFGLVISTIFIFNIFKKKPDLIDKNVAECNYLKSENERIVYCSPFLTDFGYANTIYNVISNLVIAITSDSKFLLGLNYMNEYLSLTCTSRVYRIVNKTIYKNTSVVTEILPRQVWSYEKNLEILTTTTLPDDFKILRYLDYSAYFFELCSNPKYHEKLKSHNLVSQETIKVAELALDKKSTLTHDEKLDRVLQVGFEVGGNVLNTIINLKPIIIQTMNAYFEHYFTGNYVIGIHIRNDYVVNSDISLFLDCAREIEKLKFPDEYARTNVKWFISSDKSSVFNNIVNMYGAHKIFTTNGTAKHVGYNKKGFIKALVDIELLSRCDEIITTGGSTFSFLAAMKSKRLPYYVNGHRNEQACYRMRLSQPSTTQNNAAVF